MADLTPVLVGIEGMAAGEHFVIDPDTPTSVGRSSSWAISRKHLTITITGWTARLENHSQSGSWCDDVRFDQAKEVDLGSGGVTLRIGPVEVFRLLLVDQDGLDQLLSRTRPMPLGTTRVRMPESGRETKKHG